MINTAALPVLLVAAVIATAGTWWFHTVLKNWLATKDKPLRFGLYALIWLAYFIPVVILASQAS